MPDDWLAIAEHGLIGDLRTCALVATDGTIDWFCAPRFDSAERVRRDPRPGPRRQLAAGTPHGEVSRTQQFYFPDTAVLITRFLTPDGVAEVHDFMPVARRRTSRITANAWYAGSAVFAAPSGCGCASTRDPTTPGSAARPSAPATAYSSPATASVSD